MPDRTIARPSRLASAFFPRWYRLLRWIEPVIAPLWRRGRLGNTISVVIRGRRTGQPRRTYVGLLRARGRSYLGHPDRACGWTRNLEAAGEAEITWPDGRRAIVRATPLEPGPERDAVIRTTFVQHPFPGGPIYWLARRHIAAVGRFYRLEPAPDDRHAVSSGRDDPRT